MANLKSAKKRVRSNEAKRLQNKYQAKTARNAIRDLKATTDKEEARKDLSGVLSKVDKLAKRNIIHANKANRLKSQLQRKVAAL